MVDLHSFAVGKKKKKCSLVNSPIFIHHLLVKWCERMWNKGITSNGQFQLISFSISCYYYTYGPWAYLVLLNFPTFSAKLTDEMIRKWQWSYNRFTLTFHFHMSLARTSAIITCFCVVACYIEKFIFLLNESFIVIEKWVFIVSI